jgi:hypothetical protein
MRRRRNPPLIPGDAFGFRALAWDVLLDARLKQVIRRPAVDPRPTRRVPAALLALRLGRLTDGRNIPKREDAVEIAVGPRDDRAGPDGAVLPPVVRTFSQMVCFPRNRLKLRNDPILDAPFARGGALPGRNGRRNRFSNGLSASMAKPSPVNTRSIRRARPHKVKVNAGRRRALAKGLRVGAARAIYAPGIVSRRAATNRFKAVNKVEDGRQS